MSGDTFLTELIRKSLSEGEVSVSAYSVLQELYCRYHVLIVYVAGSEAGCIFRPEAAFKRRELVRTFNAETFLSADYFSADRTAVRKEQAEQSTL